jgi:hypothetical protein
MNLQKFTAPVFTRRPGGKNTDHSAASGWLNNIVSAVKAGTPDALKRLSVEYHGVPPHMQDVNESVSARPSVAPTEPQDVPDANDMVRKIDPTPYPTAVGHHSPNLKAGTYGTLPQKGQATSSAPVRKVGDV